MPGYPAETPSTSKTWFIWYIKLQRNMHKRMILILRKLLYCLLDETLVILFHHYWIPVIFKIPIFIYSWQILNTHFIFNLTGITLILWYYTEKEIGNTSTSFKFVSFSRRHLFHYQTKIVSNEKLAQI